MITIFSQTVIQIIKRKDVKHREAADNKTQCMGVNYGTYIRISITVDIIISMFEYYVSSQPPGTPVGVWLMIGGW